MDDIRRNYENYCANESDINEHLPTLFSYANKSTRVTEFGVRSCLSTYALIYGLLKNNNSVKTYTGVDIDKHKNVIEIENLCKNTDINFKFIENSDLNIEIETTDVLFIDSWHCYGQLIRELTMHHKKVNNYIILHDTTVDGIKSEIIRMPGRWCNINKPDYLKIKEESGFSKYELETGLWPAVEKFLNENPEWKMKERFTNNNGLTVLEKNI